MSKEAMKLALEALEYIEHNYMSLPAPAEKAITALREALAEQPVLRPCRSPYCECFVGQCSHPGFYDARGEPLPPTQRTWVGLTDEEIGVCLDVGDGSMSKIIQAIEAKLRSKNEDRN